MEIIPAIDLMKGKVVRLTRGDPETVKTYESFGDPVTVARKWESDGADAIHVIDLDAALDRGNNLQEITKIVQAVNIPIQVGGGIRTLKIAQNLLRMEINRVIVGTLAFKENYALTKLLKAYGRERVVVALDHRGEEIMVRGWRKTTKISMDESMIKFLGHGVKIFLVTSISKDGTLMGPDYNTLDKATKYFGVNIIAAGGISSLEDLVNLRRIGVWGVVIGKALYEGVLKLREALEIKIEG